jgi:hypothetical protein
MSELLENKWVRVVGILLVVFVVLIVFNNAIVERTANRVIEKLHKQYAPGPYAPGFDPDKVNPDLWKDSSKSVVSSIELKDPTVWEEDWESQRRNQ